MKAIRDLLGGDEFCDYQVSLGLAARPADESEASPLGKGYWGLDSQCIAIDDGPFDLVWIRLGGAVGPRQNFKAGAFRLNIGPIPVLSNQVLPLQFHYVLWGDPGAARHDVKARLKMRKRGLWNPEIVDVRWTGGRLASLLDRDGDLTEDLLEAMAADESLLVRPHMRSGSVRIVHGCTRTVNFSLLSKEMLDFHQRLAPPELIGSIERIAGHVRRITAAGA